MTESRKSSGTQRLNGKSPENPLFAILNDGFLSGAVLGEWQVTGSEKYLSLDNWNHPKAVKAIMTQDLIPISPIDGSVAVQRPYASSAEIQAALTRAKLAQRSWQSTPLATRAALVTSAVEALVSQKDAIAEELTRQMGRPIRYTPGEVDGDRKSTRLNSSHLVISYAVFCLKQNDCRIARSISFPFATLIRQAESSYCNH